jgi:hypothetical protein
MGCMSHWGVNNSIVRKVEVFTFGCCFKSTGFIYNCVCNKYVCRELVGGPHMKANALHWGVNNSNAILRYLGV